MKLHERGLMIARRGRLWLAIALCSALLSNASIASAEPAGTRGAYLAHLSWPQAAQWFERAPVVVLPFAAGAKEHGPHLPMNADRVIMEYLSDEAVAALPVLIAPPILHGWFPAFRDFPGTEVADPDVFRAYVFEIAMSLVRQGAQRIVFLNMGVTRATGLPLAIVAREIRAQTSVPTLLVSWDDIETDEVAEFTEQQRGGHADEIETSINLFLQPERVDMSKASTDYTERAPKDYPGYRPGAFSRNPQDSYFSQTGIYGDATLASADKGERALKIMRREWLRALRGFSTEPRVPSEDSSAALMPSGTAAPAQVK